MEENITKEEIINTINVLRKEIEVLTSRLKPAGAGVLHTAIGVINNRINELLEKGMYGSASAEMVKQKQDERL